MVAAAVLVLGLANVAAYIALRETLVHASQALAVSVGQELSRPAATSLVESGQLDHDLRQAGGTIVEAIRADGVVVTVPEQTMRLVLEPNDLAAARPQGEVARRTGVDASGTPYTVAAVPLADTGWALIVARPLNPILEILRVERLILLGTGAASMLAAAGAATYISQSGLRPVRQLTAEVARVTETKNFQSIVIRHASGDLATLAAAFNQLLRSLAHVRERQSRLIADAGHELRTPLTSMSTNVDLLATDVESERLSKAQKGMILADVQAQLGELNALVGDLVHLASEDSVARFQPLDVRDVVRAAVDRVRRRGKEHVFDVQLDELHVVGDADALERVATNLLDNAVKWSPVGSTIRVRLHGNRLRVADSGPGIPEKDMPYVFDRFFRGETARKTHGTGLGLSIVAKTVEDHGGSVEVGQSSDGGAEFTVRLPGVTSREALPTILIPAH